MDRQSSSRRRRRPAQRTTSQRLTLGGTAGVILLLIVLFAQYALGVDVLHTEPKEAPPTPDSAAEPVVVPSTALVPIPGGYDGGWFQLYFTAPVPGASESTFHDSPVEAALVAAIDRAQQTVDMAIYELESQPVTDALLRAKERGVRVRVVTDGEYGLEDPDATFDQLELAGIPVVSDEARRGYMHNKFVVIDGLYVWTGSTNFKPNGFYRNNNNSMLIRSSRLAQNYTAEFEELFAGQFGASSPKTVANPVITVEGTRIETYFESEGDLGARLAELISEAHSVRFMAFSFTESLRWKENGTERSVMLLLRDRAQAGELEVKGIVEASSRSGVKPLLCAGLDIRQDGNPDVMHHKVFIFDEAIVAMGSFNFSNRAANENDENMLIIHNPDIARAYLEEFDRLWAVAGPVPAAVTADCG
jgi:phosphatidylserine/phosphatidylglycerophosphate/cardiolipin synthase-like enzyme